ncbi:winged helix-turn-helix transcriptional regulator [Mycolicibacterium vinylchloridicum]|uniref:winged helix-turn-helix transcriptional regulator n=1 Tax=Mycolicibacterium vinylchloridicum TaxID=2736928 RepID=UPI0015CB47E0|nr:helix-turn-helix domain-containing protein [Mycolicibacterium vinylchloridicum]
MADTASTEPVPPGVGPYCPYYAAAMDLLGRRWAGAVLRALVTGGMRFRELARTIPDITDRMLSQRLKDLEAGGLVERVVHPSTPVQVEYRLTPGGAALGDVLLHLNQWALDWIPLPGRADSSS